MTRPAPINSRPSRVHAGDHLGRSRLIVGLRGRTVRCRAPPRRDCGTWRPGDPTPGVNITDFASVPTRSVARGGVTRRPIRLDS